MKNSGNLLLEVERMREIMGFNTLPYQNKKYIKESVYKRNGLLLEAYTPKEDGIRYVFKALGFEDEVAESMAKQAAEQWDGFARNLGDVLEREGLDDIGKIQNSLREVAPDAARLSDPEFVENALKLYFKNNPDIAATILKETPSFYNSVIKAMDLDALIPDAPTRDGLNLVLDTADNDLSFFRDEIQDLINVLEGNATFKSSTEGQKIITGLKTKLGIADNVTSKVPDPPADTPVMRKEITQQGRTQAEIDAEDAAAEAKRKAEEDELTRKKAQEDSDRKLEELKDKNIEYGLDKLKNDGNFKKAFAIWEKILLAIGIPAGSIKKFLDDAKIVFQNYKMNDLTPGRIENTKPFQDLQKELETKARARGDVAGKIKKTEKTTNAALDLVKSIWKKTCGIIGWASTVLCGVLGYSIMSWAYNNWSWFERNISEIGMNLKSVLPNNEVYTDPKDCLKMISGFYDYDYDIRLKFLSAASNAGFSCANVDENNYSLFISKLKSHTKGKPGGRMADGTEIPPTPDSFTITIGGKDIEISADGGTITPPSPGTGKYPNTEEGFALWVSEKKTGSVFGVDYVWSDNKGFAGQGTKNADNTYPNYKPLTWKDANTGWE